MPVSFLKKISPHNFFWLSIIFHLTLLLFFVKLSQPVLPPLPLPKEPTYFYYEPPRVISAPLSPAVQTQRTKSIKTTVPIPQKPNAEKILSTANLNNPHLNPLVSHLAKEHSDTLPLHLIGEKMLDDPIRKLLGRAIMAHLYYPQLARERFRHGVVTLGFILHPDGEITEAHIVQSSKEKSLDMAALEALQEASPVANIDIYIKETKYWIVNIIF